MSDSRSVAALRTFWLSMHVAYTCRDAGACCTAGWPIPIERSQTARVDAAIAGGGLKAPLRWLEAAPAQPADVAGVLATDGLGCVFHRERHCEIHSALGHEALPSCCQHFPRDCVIDDRGVFVTLSHYCPTAAELLFSHQGPIAIIAGPEAVPGGVAEGLDARGTLPPLLTHGVLMDLPGLTAWERHVIAWLGGARNPSGRWGPEPVLDLLESHARELAAWRPGGTALSEAVAALSDGSPSDEAGIRWEDERRLRAAAMEAIIPPAIWPADPIDLEAQWPSLREAWRAHALVINRYLAAHAFASWTAYQGDGVGSTVRRLRVALAVLRAEAARNGFGSSGTPAVSLTEAIRQSDLLLVHLVDRHRLAVTLREPFAKN